MICQLFVSKCPDVNLSDGLVSTAHLEKNKSCVADLLLGCKMEIKYKENN